ncbi:MAG: T9SS type A sorting domain-containing protein [Bacteroidota bacterium]
MKNVLRAALRSLLLGSFFSTAFAGGPLATFNGHPVRYKSNIISYSLDRGPFGIFTNQQARDLANESFAVWGDVATSSVAFQHTDADTLPVDVNGTNFLEYTTLTTVKIDSINPIVFDSDGSITDALFGNGASASVIGFAWSDDVDGDGFFDEGEAFMNGALADGTPNGFTLAEWKSTFVHEFGHLLGLDHTQINGEFVGDASKTIYIPTMYPTSTVDDVPLGDLNPDDIAAISQLYPEPAFAATTGSISGSVTRRSGSVVQGANVIAVSTGADSLMNQISTITDYFDENTGGYTISGLLPGSYYVRIEPIDPDFTEGSSVGPFAGSSGDISFINPVAPEFYNGANESGDPLVDNPDERTAVAVSASDTARQIDIVANSKRGLGSQFLIESFSPAAGTLLTNAGWTISSSSTINAVTIVQPGLSFPGYSLPGTGNAALLRSTGQDVFQSFESMNTGSVYLSFLINADSAKSGDYFIALSPALVQTNYFARVHIKQSGAGYLLGLNKQAEKTGGNNYGSTVQAFGTTYGVVLKYEFISGSTTNDKLSLFVFSNAFPSVEPGVKEIDSYTNAAADPADFGNLTLRQGSSSASGQVTIDEIAVGQTWSSLVTDVKRNTPELLPEKFSLEQNFPNPFNPTTMINYQLPMNSFVTLKVYDMIGREIAALVDAEQSAGTYSVAFDGSGLSSGLYFYSLQTKNFTVTKKMLLLK